ncbi:hypothetical protein YN1_7990 [Nanoarchaeota archaeon]
MSNNYNKDDINKFWYEIDRKLNETLLDLKKSDSKRLKSNLSELEKIINDEKIKIIFMK